jgi:hypothetical protein
VLKKIILGFVMAILLAGCAATPPPAPRSTASVPVPTASPGQAVSPDQAASTPVAPVQQRPKATGTLEDAHYHMVRGMAAIEMAKSEAELAMAEDEFRIATEIAPQMANAWFNLGKTQSQLGKYGDAIASYRQYLECAPDAEDAPKVRNEIIKLEFRQEVAAKIQSRAGAWIGEDGAFYNLTLDGNRMTLKTKQHYIPIDEIRTSYSITGNAPLRFPSTAEYQLVFQGNRLTGTWTRSPVQADKCPVPADTSGVTGELFDLEGKMVLTHERTSFHAATIMSLFGDDTCKGVTSRGRTSVKETIYGPLAKGGLGVEPYGLQSWWDGGFSAVQDGWQGRLAIGVKPDTPAYLAGLRNMDEILAIDGVPVKSLSAGQAIVRLRGEPGSTVTLEVWRKTTKEQFTITMTRSAV